MIKLLAIGFLIGLTGAVVPGPMLFATIEASLRRGWIAGHLIVLGHAAVEVLICGVILLGFSIANDIVFDIVSLVGGGALIIFGMMMLRSSRNATFDVKTGITGSPVVAGALTSVSNPYFLVWWLTIGNSMVMDGLRIGVVAALLFIIGHWIADIVW
ncbi:MAG: LysE family transporter, partial [Methanosarcinales archaeon]|nr:LysE family transporter [Methanosarcinales archaeon]